MYKKPKTYPWEVVASSISVAVFFRPRRLSICQKPLTCAETQDMDDATTSPVTLDASELLLRTRWTRLCESSWLSHEDQQCTFKVHPRAPHNLSAQLKARLKFLYRFVTSFCFLLPYKNAKIYTLFGSRVELSWQLVGLRRVSRPRFSISHPHTANNTWELFSLQHRRDEPKCEQAARKGRKKAARKRDSVLWGHIWKITKLSIKTELSDIKCFVEVFSFAERGNIAPHHMRWHSSLLNKFRKFLIFSYKCFPEPLRTFCMRTKNFCSFWLEWKPLCLRKIFSSQYSCFKATRYMKVV